MSSERNEKMKAKAIARVVPAAGSVWLLLPAFLALQYPLASRADEVSDGKAAFAQCSGCHTVTGKEGLGPHLNGVIGRKAGTVAGFNYSPAMKRSAVVWDEATLEKYIQNPQTEIPGNRMPFAGLQDAQKRTDIAAYLTTLK